MTTKDTSYKLAGTTNRYMTEDYDQFVTLKGNRNVKELHVKRLMKQMTENGNMIDQFPIVINEKMEVVDGQHRLEALRRLKWPVVYEVKEGLTVDAVRVINSGHQNWTWYDYAVSFAELGNENYQRFLNLYKHFGFNYSVLLYYSDSTINKRSGSHFYTGEFKLNDQKKAFDLLEQYRQVADAAEHDTREFAYAMKDVMQSASYDHKRMVDKMNKYGHMKLKPLRAKTDYLRMIEEIYNTYVGEDQKVRLF